MNAYNFNAPEPEIVLVMESLASGEIDESTSQVWLAKYADQLHE
ncbi:hypothetical protein [Atlanticothrix silvestris]|nr:hypothetical protein [Atlanticothrix silvestris]